MLTHDGLSWTKKNENLKSSNYLFLFFFFLLVKITSKGPLCLESSFTWQPLLPRKTVLWMCTHSLLAIFVKIVAAWVNQEERHCFSPAVDSELVLSDPSFLLIFFLSSSSSFFSSSSRWSSSRPAGLELSINKDYFQFLILLPSPPRYWDYRCAASRVTLYLTRLMLFRLPSLFKKKNTVSCLLVLIDNHVMTLLFLYPELISNLLTIYVCYPVDISWAGMGHSV